MKKQKQKQIKILRILKKLLEVILDGFWEKQPHESLKFPNIEPISEFLIKNWPWFRKQSSKNNKKTGAGSSCLGKSQDCEWVEFPKVGTKGQQKERVDKGKSGKICPGVSPPKKHIKFQSCDVKDLCFFRGVWEFGWIFMYFLIFPRRIVAF